MSKQNAPGIQVGSSSILVTFVLLCLITFATLSLVTVKGDENLSRDAGENVSAYYEAEKTAQTIIGEADIFVNDLVRNAEVDEDISSKVFVYLPGMIAQYAEDNNLLVDKVTVGGNGNDLTLSFTVPYSSATLYVEAQIIMSKECSLKITSLKSVSGSDESDDSEEYEEPHLKLLF